MKTDKRLLWTLEHAEAGVSSPDLAAEYGCSNCVAANLLKRAMLEGWLDRQSGRQPYRYRLTALGRTRLQALKSGTPYVAVRKDEDAPPWDFGPLLECWG